MDHPIDPTAAELAKVRGILRVTEDELGRQRELSAKLGRKLAAERQRTAALRSELRMLEAVRGSRPQEPPDCEPRWEKPPATTMDDGDRFEDVPTGEFL